MWDETKMVFVKTDVVLLQAMFPQDAMNENDASVTPLHRFPMVEERWDSWSAGEDTKQNHWNAEFNQHHNELLERHSALFDETGQLSPPGVREMLEQIKKTVEVILATLKATKLRGHGQEVFVTLHPCDRIRFTNLGAALFMSALMLILLGSNMKFDKHSKHVMGLLVQGVAMDEERKVEKRKASIQKKTERREDNLK